MWIWSGPWKKLIFVFISAPKTFENFLHGYMDVFLANKTQLQLIFHQLVTQNISTSRTEMHDTKYHITNWLCSDWITGRVAEKRASYHGIMRFVAIHERFGFIFTGRETCEDIENLVVFWWHNLGLHLESVPAKGIDP